MPQERKLVTVLFADVVGSTEFGVSTDPEIVRRVLGRAFAEMRATLELHGATVEKFIGDAVMAVFGIPHGHEDDADRAVRAAFALCRRVAALNKGGQPSLTLRIGIESGQVVTGIDGAETLVTGVAVNAAARLQQAAVAGEILVGDMTRKLAEGGVRFGNEREVTAKGFGSFLAYPAQALTTELPEQHRGIVGFRAPLIGREDELQLLVDSHRRANSERRAFLVTVFGGAGVGKSRLVADFVETLGQETVLRGRCLSYGEGITYWAVSEMLRADFGIIATDSHEDATRKLRASVLSSFGEANTDADGIARRLSVLAGTASVDKALSDVEPANVAAELRWGFRRYLERRAANMPVTLIFDDIHAAEPPLLDLIEHLAEWARVPLFLLCLARPELRERRPTWAGGLLNAAAIALDPLTPEESARLVRELLAFEALPEELGAQIVARSGGNPLFVEEFLRMLIDAGHMERREGEWLAPTSLRTLVLPPTLHGIIGARLDQVPSETKRVLQCASIVGKDFWTDAVAAQDLLGGKVDELLQDAARRDFVSELSERGLAGGRAYTFKHILIRDVAYEAIPKEDRHSLHDLFGRWLQNAAGDRHSEYADIVAYHAEQAFLLANELGDADASELAARALDLLLTAAHAARRRADTVAAYAVYSRALAVADAFDSPPALRLDALAFAAVARMGIEPGVEANAGLGKALSELRAVGPREALVAVLAVLASQAADSDLELARSLHTEALAAARAVGDEELIAGQLLQAHWPDWIAGRLDDDRERLEEALAFARAHGVSSVAARCLSWLSTNATIRGDIAAARKHVTEAEGLALESGSILTRHYLTYGRWNVERYSGDLDAAERTARAGIALAAEIGVRFRLGTTRWWLADVLAERNEHAASRAEFEKSVQDLTAATSAAFRAEALAQLTLVCVAMSDVRAAERYAEEACALVSPDDVFTVASSRRALAEVRAVQGRDEEAEQAFRDAIAAVEGTGYRLARAGIVRAYGAYLVSRGRFGEARPLLESVRAFFASPLTAYERAKADALLAKCAEAS